MSELFRKRSRRLSAILAGVPLVLGALAFWAAAEYRSRLRWVTHTIETLNEIDTLMLTLTRAESTQRGYLLTGNTEYLDEYHEAAAQIPRELADLRQLTLDNAVQQHSAEQLTPLVQERTRWFEQVLAARQEPLAARREHVGGGIQHGTELMHRIRSILTAMSAEELRLLEMRRSALSTVESRAAILFAVTIATALVLLYMGQRLIVQFAEARGEAEAALQQLNADLERRVEERTTDLRAANEQLRRSNDDLTRFAYVASHDLQEPLRTVGSYAGLLGRRYKGKLDEQADTYIYHVVDGAKRMQTLVQDLLKYARVGTQALNIDRISLDAAVDVAVNNLQAAIAETRAEITRGTLPSIDGDADRLTLVFQNLIANSLKFRKPDEPPRVHVSADRDGKEWLVHIRDNGIGFEPEYAQRIFVIFQRLHEVGAFPGTGIGLAICKRIVEAHGGRIWAESTPGAGSIFSFSLPMHQPSQSDDTV